MVPLIIELNLRIASPRIAPSRAHLKTIVTLRRRAVKGLPRSMTIIPMKMKPFESRLIANLLRLHRQVLQWMLMDNSSLIPPFRVQQIYLPWLPIRSRIASKLSHQAEIQILPQWLRGAPCPPQLLKNLTRHFWRRHLYNLDMGIRMAVVMEMKMATNLLRYLPNSAILSRI